MLLTKQLRSKLPALYSQEDKGKTATVQVKFFTPTSGWTWFATEFDGVDLFFGYADDGRGGGELGYFSLAELESVKGPFGLGVERDKYFVPKTLDDAIDEVGR